MTVKAYKKLSEICDYPLHLGVTEAGGLLTGSIKSSIGIGQLLMDGIGDTIRVSLSSDPIDEIKAGYEILKSLGLSEPVTSPTFTIIEPYLIKDKKIYHIDLYRIESRKELEVLGIEEYSAENDCLIFIEWPEKAEGFFSEYDLKIRLSHINEFSRELIIEKS